jgi:CRP-like cAMP-binding protein
MQLGGTAIKINYAEARAAFASSEEIRQRVLDYVQYQGSIVSQIAACNKLHESEARLARWLLMVQERTGLDLFTLRQQFIAEMLGSQRSTVALVAGALQRAGFIEYKRAKIRILDRERLEDAACTCHPIMHQLFKQLYR